MKQFKQLLHHLIPKFQCFEDFSIANAYNKQLLKLQFYGDNLVSEHKFKIEFLLPGTD